MTDANSKGDQEIKEAVPEPHVKKLIQTALEEALVEAKSMHTARAPICMALTPRLRASLESLSQKAEKAKTGFTNIVTALAIKVARPELDVRKYKVEMGAPFSFRDVSEDLIYPFLAGNEFTFAQSGWQTRVFERKVPYTMDYPENIGHIKDEFLAVYDEVESGGDAKAALQYLLYLQMGYREGKRIDLASPQISVIHNIVALFEGHFFHNYKGTKGASRLPVLAIYALYQEMVKQLSRYDGKKLRPLQKHSAADEQTGAIGDIEVESGGGEVFEAIEIKHGILIDEDVINTASRKIALTKVKRYYILTTHSQCRPTTEITDLLKEKLDRTGVQVIVNGVVPTLTYYLRLLDEPGRVIPNYVALLAKDTAITFAHRQAWNDGVAGVNRGSQEQQ